jgi:antitoxin (DNA-binding transcriptional repressor) of toxin-antitoxin stability system
MRKHILAVWISKLKPGEELVIIQRDRPFARLVAEPLPTVKPRQPGSAIGRLTIIKDDDSHLEDFREYMP